MQIIQSALKLRFSPVAFDDRRYAVSSCSMATTGEPNATGRDSLGCQSGWQRVHAADNLVERLDPDALQFLAQVLAKREMHRRLQVPGAREQLDRAVAQSRLEQPAVERILVQPCLTRRKPAGRGRDRPARPVSCVGDRADRALPQVRDR